MAERDGVTLICSSGKRRCISSVAAVISTSTRRSKLRERSSSSQISSETSPGESPLTRTWVGVTTRASATLGSVTETRLSLSVVLMRMDFPTITRSGAAAGFSGALAAELAGGVCALFVGTAFVWALSCDAAEVVELLSATLVAKTGIATRSNGGDEREKFHERDL